VIERRGASVLIPSVRVRRLVQLIGEAGELARTAVDPQLHLIEGLLELVGGDLGVFCPMPRHMVPGTNTLPLAFTRGWTEEMRRVTSRLYEQNNGSGKDPFATVVIPRTRPGTATVGPRQEFVPDGEWYRSPFVNEFRRPQRHDHSIYAILKSADDRVTGFALCRTWGEKAHSDVDRTLVELFVEACAGHLFLPGSARPLSPREREVRRRLLDGAAPKQIAADLGLSIHTVNDYVHAIYRAEGVTTRAELLVRALHGRRQDRAPSK
jgi:DNA-binding CsgD family transcriptional regulator